MEGEIWTDESDDFAVTVAPYTLQTKKTNGLSHTNSNTRSKFPVLNGKQLKVRVVKLNGTDLGKPSVVSLLSRSDRHKTLKGRKPSSRSPHKKDSISNNNTITDRTDIKAPALPDTVPSEELNIENSLSQLCSNCGSCADSPQSLLSEDNSSQASDSIFIKGDHLLQRSNSSHSVESSQSQNPADIIPSGNCKWTNCTDSQVDLTHLQDHINANHIQNQTSNGSFVCLWTGCKVYNKPSLSRAWLERHVLHHSGGKPFKCIIAGCRLRFSSRVLQERHVRSHFETYQNPSGKGGKDGPAGTPTKGGRKRKLKKKMARPIKTHDYFDPFVMEKIRAKLLCGEANSHNGSTTTFRSSVIAKRQEPNGTTSVLLHWNPPSVRSDEWVSETQAAEIVGNTHNEPLPHSSQPSTYSQHRFRKHRRK